MEKIRFSKLQQDMAGRPLTMAFSALLHLLVIICLISDIITGDIYSAYFCLITLILFRIPAFSERFFGIYLPPIVRSGFMLFIFFAEILGEMAHLYVRIPMWDVMLHTLSGFLFGAIGVGIFQFLNKENFLRLKASPAFRVISVIGFSVCLGVIWEFFEFFCDASFQTDMQKDNFIHSIYSVSLDRTDNNKTARIYNIEEFSVNGESFKGGYLDIGLIDTMKDMTANFAGALVFALVLFKFLKSKGQSKISVPFIPLLKKKATKNK